MNRTIIALLLLLSACVHDMPAPIDPSKVTSEAADARKRVNELATQLGQLSGLIQMACAAFGKEDPKCTTPTALYNGAREAVQFANRYIDAFAKTGLGLSLVDAGLETLETAVGEVVDATDGLVGKVAEVAGHDSGGTSGGEDPVASGPDGVGERSQGDLGGGAPSETAP